MNFLDLKNTHLPLREQLHEAARRVIDSGIYINGPECRSFSKKLSQMFGLGYLVPVSNGLDALRLIIRGYMELGRLHPGDEVLVPSNTYIASVLPVVEFGLTPVLVKPDLKTFGLDWEAAEKALSPRVKAVIAVHLYGTPGWDFEIADHFREQGILLIEDNAQAIGAGIRRNPDSPYIFTGALGDASAFSFYPTKNIGALGDAGAVATSDKDLAETVKALANYGSRERYRNIYIGFNCRMDELQAALLQVKLSHLEALTEARRKNALLYSRFINHSDVSLPPILPDMIQVWHQYVIRVSNREVLRRYLDFNDIATDVHYPTALVDQKCLQDTNPPVIIDRASIEISRTLAFEVLSLPIANVSEDEIKQIAKLINTFS